MVKHPATKNLFGESVPQRRPRYEVALERIDKRKNAVRASRMRWLNDTIPGTAGYVLPVETALIFEEAKSCFIYGNFVATIILAASFVDHWFAASLESQGHGKQASRGLAASIKFARTKNLVDRLVPDKVEQLRLIRNPFVHLKSFDHEHAISQRAYKHNTDPWTLIESDAKDALIAMYGVAAYAFVRTTCLRPPCVIGLDPKLSVDLLVLL